MESEEGRRSDEPMLTLRQAAERTGLSATTLRRYIKSSRLRARLVPGRYGPEYVVGEDDLRAAGVVLDPPRDLASPPAPLRPAPPPRDDATHAARGELVPAMLYRELLMKHEQLLVQFGMLKATGRRMFESHQEIEERAASARGTARELERLRQRHSREIGELKAELRRSELEIAAKSDELRERDRTIRMLEMRVRNAEKARAFEERLARALPDAEERPVPPAPETDSAAPLDH